MTAKMTFGVRILVGGGGMVSACGMSSQGVSACLGVSLDIQVNKLSNCFIVNKGHISSFITLVSKLYSYIIEINQFEHKTKPYNNR